MTTDPSTRSLLSIDDLGRDGIETVLALTREFREVNRRPIPKVPALRGKTIANCFFEDSTRTRISFEIAAKRLSADTITFTQKGSSLSKGESLRDTVRTLCAMGVNALICRHEASGAPARIAQWVDVPVINAGDGAHEHPTQALLDLATVAQHRDGFEGLRTLIVGDIAHSRVARSNVLAFSAMGADVTVCGPATLLPPGSESWPAAVTTDFDAALEKADIVYLLRMQQERIEADPVFGSIKEYVQMYGLTAERAARLDPETLVMHPGPMNRGIEIASEAADLPASLVEQQVANGVAVRMAVLYLALGGTA
ncbi:MAG: aspartate carbamoyltransferase catalytic subunit [Acidimicrobiia bacterium]